MFLAENVERGRPLSTEYEVALKVCMTVHTQNQVVHVLISALHLGTHG